MDIIWSGQKLLRLLQSFYTIINVRVGFFDLAGKEIMAFPASRSGFCNLIRSCPAGDAACVRCDSDAFRYASKHQSVYMYRCHAGLTEMIAPIIQQHPSFPDEPVAYLMVGQVREGAGRRQRRDVREWVAPFGLNEPALKKAYDKLPSLEGGQLAACGNILQALATYMWLDHFVRVQNEPLSFKLKEYIAGNINNELSLPLLGEKLGAGKTNLCAVCKRDFGMTVNELVRTMRIERAKQLLQQCNDPIYSIAEQVGISDYNYFSKVFKAECGLAPSDFRRLCREDHKYAAGRKGGFFR